MGKLEKLMKQTSHRRKRPQGFKDKHVQSAMAFNFALLHLFLLYLYSFALFTQADCQIRWSEREEDSKRAGGGHLKLVTWEICI